MRHFWDPLGPQLKHQHPPSCSLRPGHCCYFSAGSATKLRISEQDGVPVLHDVTLWVESWAANRTEKSPKVTLKLYSYGQYPVLLPPPPGCPFLTQRCIWSLDLGWWWWWWFWAPSKGLENSSHLHIKHCCVIGRVFHGSLTCPLLLDI